MRRARSRDRGRASRRARPPGSCSRLVPVPAPDPGLDPLRTAPPGLPAVDARPPVIAESGDPFAAARVIDLVARLPRGRALPIATIVDRLNASYPDWLFE